MGLSAAIKEAPPPSPLRRGRIVKLLEAQTPQASYYKPQVGKLTMITDVMRDTVRVMSKGVLPIEVKNDLKVESVGKADKEQFLEELKKEPYIAVGCNTTTGSDPEIFAVDENGAVIPAWAYLPDKAHRLEFSNGRRAVDGQVAGHMFWDGVQAEYTIPAYYCHMQTSSALKLGMKHVWEAARTANPRATLTHKCVLDVAPEVFRYATPEQVDLGCDPSTNVYGERHHLDGLNPAELPFRFAGFHMHFGWQTKPEKEVLVRMVKAMDKIVGVISVKLLRGLEDERRRRYYGQAGEYRLPSHGLEYRVLSSACLIHPAVNHFIMDMARAAASMAFYSQSWMWEAEQAEVEDAINNLNVDAADRILTRNRDLLSKIILRRYEAHGRDYDKKGLAFIDQGAAQFVGPDLVKNWNLTGDAWNPDSTHYFAGFAAKHI